MKATRRRDTSAERILRSALTMLGLRYRVDFAIAGTRRRADVVFTKAKLAVFVDGCFWHVCPKHASWPKSNAAWWRDKLIHNVARDRDTDALLKQSGWHVVRIWEHENPNAAARVIAAKLRKLKRSFMVRSSD